jgi:hypothetical protein
VLACEDAWDRREPAAASPSYATPAAVAS